MEQNRVASSLDANKNYLGGWLFVGTIAIAVLSATLVIERLQYWSDQAANYELQLSRLQAATNRLDALEWKAISQKKVTSDLQAALEKHREQSEAILVELKKTADSPEDLQEVNSTYATYVEAVNQLLELLNAGKISEALEVDEEKVDPSYEKLHETIVEESVKAVSTAKTIRNYAFWGSMLTSLVLIAAISAVFRRYRQASQKTQLALFEQESLRRSEQVLQQERQVLETKVFERTQELEEKNTALRQALFDLKQSQMQLIQSEKMSSLGLLVAGVAHEINNPVGCIVGNAPVLKDSIADLFTIIDLYCQRLPQPDADIEKMLAEIDLDYLRVDLPKLVQSIQDGGDRIQAISHSLRTFSRGDTDSKVSTNVHDSIDSTLLILKYRLKANEHRPAIQVIKNYGDLPEIECFPGQLNQVFMNIFANAIDVFDEVAQASSFAELKDNPQIITIQTALIENAVEIRIRDNGKGMTEEVKARIFNYLFTTKGVGKGTGLGLAIARQIVVEKHGGSIKVDSVLGQGTEFTIFLPANG